ncbi:hypothetical protein bpr_II153 (plasmid) [Butyrivibrio proteoclasticus B316]|uniref:Uncharacterized protein n=1 Tax=Butyrivibrio proteoclasticus (strain ATCC 51982 / DSM 14932 / B316) TaxID=515622 RepID=E0S3V9_BUTPB|nr:hypothetical protein [Butyrivibrio proteoclasticus]ADL36091.1 hypothetical protein bpr_II153 [Butyrivibrio proteoclasticus B316]
MNKNEFKLRHIRVSISDFLADRHRFKFEYEGDEYEAACYSSVDIQFGEDAEKNIPEEVLSKITKEIYKKIDENEGKNWRYPEKARAIADTYCEEEFA